MATFSGRRTTVFTASSGCFIYDPVANSWTDVSHSGMYYWTKDIVVDPYDATQNTWYVGVFSGWGGAPNGLGGLYKTTNRGAAWTKLTGSTLDRVTSCTIYPINNNDMYITTETQGLWKGTNINSASPNFSNVASYPFRQPERVFFNPNVSAEMWVTSFGNGMKMGAFPLNSMEEAAGEEFSVYPNPFSETAVIRITNFDELRIADIKIFDVLGKEIHPEIIRIPIAIGTDSFVIRSGALTNGIYFLKVGNITKKIVIQK